MISKGKLRKLGDRIFTIEEIDFRATYESDFALKLYKNQGVCFVELSLAKWAKAEELFNQGYTVQCLGDLCG
jgi:hypothetical protein